MACSLSASGTIPSATTCGSRSSDPFSVSWIITSRMNQLASQAGGYISSRQVVAATIILHARMRETLAGAGRGDR